MTPTKRTKSRRFRAGEYPDLNRSEAQQAARYYKASQDRSLASLTHSLAVAGKRLTESAAAWNGLRDAEPDRLVGMLLDLALAQFDLWEIAQDAKILQTRLLSQRQQVDPLAFQGLLLARMQCPPPRCGSRRLPSPRVSSRQARS
jgi:hypothetical protein